MAQETSKISATSMSSAIRSTQNQRILAPYAIHGTPSDSAIEYSTSFSPQPTKFARISLEDLTITQTKIGSGNFADIFLVIDSIGKQYALKKFKTLPQKPGITEKQTLEYIQQNIFDNKELLSSNPFTELQVIPEYGAWYLMSYFEGISLSTALSKNILSKKQKQSALLTFANMIEKIHKQKLCYVDINPNCILVSRPKNAQDNITTRICDYDLMNSENALFDSPFSQIGSVVYASREQLVNAPHRQVSDLESFALLLDHVYNGSPLRNASELDVRALQRQAMNQEQLYPAERLFAVPQPLRNVMREVLIYDRGDAPTARDFITALERAS